MLGTSNSRSSNIVCIRNPVTVLGKVLENGFRKEAAFFSRAFSGFPLTIFPSVAFFPVLDE